MTTPKDPATDDPIALLTELRSGGELILDNAEQLYNEAILLRRSGAFARAVCLHQLSNEECGKIELLGGWAMSIVLGHNVDVGRITRALRDHRAKNYANAYFSDVTDDELSARKQGDWAKALAIFRNRQAELHSLFNEHKNATLYVSFQDGKFSAPKDVISEALADEMRVLNEYFLGIATQNVRLLRGVESNDWGSRSAAKHFVARLEEVTRQQPDDPEACLRTVMQEMLDALGRQG